MDLFQKLFSSPALMLRVSVALCYIALGVYLIVNMNLFPFVDRRYTPFLSGMFIAYGAFRLYRAVNDLRNA